MRPPPSNPPFRWRFFTTVLAFALVNAIVWIAYIGYDQSKSARPRPLLRVERFTPGDNQTVAGRPTLAWVFNVDAAPAGMLNPIAMGSVAGGAATQPSAKPMEPVATIDPPVAGRWAWRDARTLTFQPDADLPRATRFTVNLPSDRIRTADGFQLDKAFTASLQTAALQVAGVQQVDVADGQVVLEVQFTDEVLPADALSHMSVRGPNDEEVPFSPHGDAAGRTVRIRTDRIDLASPTADARLTLHISPGLAGKGGPLAMTTPYAGAVNVSAALAATSASANCPPSGNASISLNFNRRADVERVRQVLSVEPAVPFTLSNDYGGVQITGAFQPATRYALKLAKPAAGSKADEFPRPDVLSVFVPDRPSDVSFDHDEGYLGSAGNRTIMARAVNVRSAKVTVTRVYDNNVVAWRNATASRSRYSSTGPDAYARPIATKDFDLLGEKNKPRELPLSLDELLPQGAARDGVYEIAIAADVQAGDAGGDWDGTGRRGYASYYTSNRSAMVTLSDIGLSAKQGRDGITVWAASLRTAEPLAGVRVRVFSSKGQQLGEGKTDADGLAKLAGLNPAPGETATVVLADRPSEASQSDAVLAADSSGKTPAPSAGLTWLDLRTAGLSYADADTTGRPYLRNGHEAMVYTDRGVYRPGETVRLRAIVRGADGATPKSFPLRWQFRRPDLRDWRSQQTELDADGSAGVDLQLPADLPTGRWSAHVGLHGKDKGDGAFFGSVAFQVEEFMPDRMKVSVDFQAGEGKTPVQQRFALGGVKLSAVVQGDYLFGQPADGLAASLVARIEPATFAHDKWRGWTFGDAAGAGELVGGGKTPLARRVEMKPATLDKRGKTEWELDLPQLIAGGEVVDPAGRPSRASRRSTPKPDAAESVNYVGPWRLSVATSVNEVGGRAVSASRQIDVDPAAYYLGINATAASATPGQPFAIDIAAVAPDGTAATAAGEVEVSLFREAWNSSLVQTGGRYRYESTRLLERSGEPWKVSLASGKANAALIAPSGGSYVACVRDPKTGGVATYAFLATFGSWDDNISRENPEKLEIALLPAEPTAGEDAAAMARRFGRATGSLIEALYKGDAKAARLAFAAPAEPIAPAAVNQAANDDGREHKFRAGGKAQVVVRSPFAGRLLLSVETDGLVSTRVMEMPKSQISVPIDVPEACRPNAYVTASVIRPVDPNAKWRPHRAAGVARLVVDNGDRKLNVAIAAPKEMLPSNTLSAGVRITDASGKPVGGAAVTVAAVDEGICLLTDFKTPDPFGFFTATRALGVTTADLYSQLMPEVARPDKTSPTGGDGGEVDRHRSPVAAKRVKPVALWAGVLHTDADGLARAEFQVPQFAGQLRLMAVAYNGPATPPAFGSTAKPVLVRSPLIMQSSWPRFAAPGDQFQVPLAVFNNTSADGTAKITVRLIDEGGKACPLNFPKAGEREMTLPPVSIKAGGQAKLAFDVAAADRIGVGRAVLVAELNGQTFEEQVELPVRPANPELTDGGYATATPDKPAKLVIPAGNVDGAGRFELHIMQQPTLNLPNGLDYLERYPYGCLEQTLSTCFPLAALGDIGTQIAPGVFERDRVARKVQVGITRLIGMQTANGGLSMWPGGREAWPWASVYAAHFLVEARAAGHDVPDDFHDHLFAYVRGLLAKSGDAPDLVEAQAYACYVLALSGKPERATMSRLSEILNGPVTDPSLAGGGRTSARFHLAAAWVAAGRRDLAGGLIPKILPKPREGRQLTGNIGSAVRDRAVMLTTLLAVDPDDPALPALAQSLADAGRDGQWRSTQDTAFAVLALGRYFRTTKAAAPYATAELWRNGERVATAEAGKPLTWDATAQPADGRSANPMPIAGTAFEVRITGDAGAKAHVAWLQNGIPQKPAASADAGLEVRRRYLDRDGQPIKGDQVRSGDLVHVELSLTSAGPLDNVVIEDLLPAGMEIENPRLQTTAAATGGRAIKAKREADVFADDRLDVRDDRLVLIGRMQSAGTGKYVYAARAVAPGRFVVPPVRAECMYDLGTNSVWGGGTLTVHPIAAPPVAAAARAE